MPSARETLEIVYVSPLRTNDSCTRPMVMPLLVSWYSALISLGIASAGAADMRSAASMVFMDSCRGERRRSR